MRVASDSKVWRAAFLLLTMSIAAIGGLVLLLMLWKYVPARAAQFACVAEPLPRMTAVVFGLAKWTIRLLPFLIILSGPILGAVGVGVIALAVTERHNPVWVKRTTLAFMALVGVEAAAAGLISYASRPPHAQLERVCIGRRECTLVHRRT